MKGVGIAVVIGLLILTVINVEVVSLAVLSFASIAGLIALFKALAEKGG